MVPLHLAGIAAWVVVAALLIWPSMELPRPGRTFALTGGLIFALAVLSLLSTIWSVSVAASLAEFERVVAYLGFFTASYLTTRTPKHRERFTRGIAAGLAFIVLLAIGDRLIPGGEPATADFGFNRLSFPLGYWNGVGVMSAAGIAFFLWLAVTSQDARWRAGLVGLATLACSTLYLTYSRGGLLVAICAMILLFFLSGRRLKLFVATVITVAASVPALLLISRYPAISGAVDGDPTTGESFLVAGGILLCLALAAVALEAAVRLARRRPELVRRPLAISRDRRVLASIAGAGLAALLALVLVFGEQAWEQFSDSDIPVTGEHRTEFTELSGSWRYDFLEVALDTFAREPLLGTGAGTWLYAWNRDREVHVTSLDAHSFYLQNLSDLGIPGGLLSFGLAASLIWLGVLALRRRLSADAPLILAITTALLLAFSLDWFWRLGATAALLMMLAAWITGSGALDRRLRSSGLSPGLRIGGLLAAWFAVVALAVPAIADHYERASADSLESGRLEQAADRANVARRLAPWSAGPHMQLGAIAESRGQTELAIAEYTRAVELEPESWQARLLRFDAYLDDGRQVEARRDLAALREINPLYFGWLTGE